MSGNRSKSAFVEGAWVTLSADFRGKGASPTNHCWRQKTGVIAVSCGIKICAVHCLVLSQYTHLTEGRTDRRTELRQQYRALHYMQSHGKNQSRFLLVIKVAYIMHTNQECHLLSESLMRTKSHQNNCYFLLRYGQNGDKP